MSTKRKGSLSNNSRTDFDQLIDMDFERDERKGLLQSFENKKIEQRKLQLNREQTRSINQFFQERFGSWWELDTFADHPFLIFIVSKIYYYFAIQRRKKAESNVLQVLLDSYIETFGSSVISFCLSSIIFFLILSHGSNLKCPKSLTENDPVVMWRASIGYLPKIPKGYDRCIYKGKHGHLCRNLIFLVEPYSICRLHLETAMFYYTKKKKAGVLDKFLSFISSYSLSKESAQQIPLSLSTEHSLLSSLLSFSEDDMNEQ